MKLSVRAKPGAHEERVTETAPGQYEVAVTEPPFQGRANAAITRALAEHFGVAAARVRIVSGWTSRSKVIEVL